MIEEFKMGEFHGSKVSTISSIYKICHFCLSGRYCHVLNNIFDTGMIWHFMSSAVDAQVTYLLFPNGISELKTAVSYFISIPMKDLHVHTCVLPASGSESVNISRYTGHFRK